MIRVLVCVVAMTALSACAARRVPLELAASAANADALAAAGCYHCLQEALAIYERVVSDPAAPPDTSRRAFETAVLLSARAKELGLPPDGWLSRAQALAARAPSSPGRLSPAAYLDALALIGGELSGFSPEERETRGRVRRAAWPNDGSVPPARTALSAAEDDATAQYLALAIDCEDARRRQSLDPAPVLARHDTPLIRFRIAACGFDAVSIDSLRAVDARWVDTLFIEGRREMTRFPAPDLGKAAELLQRAHEAFPDSAAITLAAATARNALGEHEAALALFDHVLATNPRHREALLGRVMSLSYLNRSYEAVAAATRMIELGTYLMGDAYYWRAWNQYRVHRLPEAWDDIERARALRSDTAVYTLAGFIAFAQTYLETAAERLARAHELDRANCEAVWTEGLVHVELEAWEVAGARFGTAMACYASDADAARRERDAAAGANIAESIRARQVAEADKRAAASEHRRAQSAFNAASAYVRLRQKALALTYVDTAAAHPLLKDKAAVLRGAIEKLPDDE